MAVGLKTVVINSHEEIDDSAGPCGRAYVKFAVNERRRQFGLSIFKIALLYKKALFSFFSQSPHRILFSASPTYFFSLSLYLFFVS